MCSLQNDKVKGKQNREKNFKYQPFPHFSSLEMSGFRDCVLEADKKPAQEIVVVGGSPTAGGNTHQPAYLTVLSLTH